MSESELWGCAHNEERSPYSTGRQTCFGTLHDRTRIIEGIEIRYYICTGHESEDY